jgi:hypothetical protein
MPSISYESFAAWSNYHLTRGDDPAALVPAMTIDEIGRVQGGDLDGAGLERFGAFAEKLLGHVRRVKDKAGQPGAPARFAAGLVGQGWSFAPLIGTTTGQLICNGMAGVCGAARGDLDRHCPVGRSRVAFALGGTRLREIATWAEARKLSIATSGTHLGPTIAGGFGTASHGSRLGYGGLQDMVLGMHLVVGEDKHVWLEPKSRPVLSEAGIAKLAADGRPVELNRDDARFADALIHLGAMGIVCGVALELVPVKRFAKRIVEAAVTPAWLEAIGRGEHAALARKLGCKVAPAFHELTLDPFDPYGASALHTMYFPTLAQDSSGPPVERVSPADAIARFGKDLHEGALHEHLQAAAAAAVGNKADAAGDPDPDDLRRAVATVLQGATSAYAAYRGQLKSVDRPGPFDPNAAGVPKKTWSELHDTDEITGGFPGALYNASFAIPRERTAEAVAAICAAVKTLPGVFVFTLRFVSNAAGTLAFTRFAETTVMEIDGVSPLLCKLAIARIVQGGGGDDRLVAALAALAPSVPLGARAGRGALAGIPYSMHWAKLGDLDAAKVGADYDAAGTPDTPLKRWRQTRAGLLTPFGRQVFWNEAVVAYGLL